MPTKALLRAFGAIGAGLLLWLAFPDHGLWWTPPIAVALITLCLWRVRARTGALLGFVFGMAFFLPTLSWSGVYVGAFPWTALAVLESLYMAALGAAVALVQRRRIAPFVVGPPPPLQEPLRGQVATLSAAQADVCDRRDVPFVDTFTPLADHEQWHEDLATGDGLHPGQAGYGLMAWLVLHSEWHAWLGVSPA